MKKLIFLLLWRVGHPSIVFQNFGKLAKVKSKSLGKIEKYAIVSDRKWVDALFPMANFFSFSMELKHFSKDEYQVAKDWLTSIEKKEVNADEYFTEVDIERIEGTRNLSVYH